LQSCWLLFERRKKRGICCAAAKLEKAAEWLDHQRYASRGGGLRGPGAVAAAAVAAVGETESNELERVVRDCTKLAESQLKGLASQVVKHSLFNNAPRGRGQLVAGDGTAGT
jgi:Cop9 signalosome subunit 5 C-terminal domain